MKKILFIAITMIGLALISCSNEQKTPEFKKVKMETAYVFDKNIIHEEDYSLRKYHVVINGDNLYDLSRYYFGDSTLWGQLLLENPGQTAEADLRSFRVPEKDGPGWLLNPGEIIMLPNHTSATKSFGPRTRVIFDLGNKKLSSFKRNVPVKTDKELYTLENGSNSDYIPGNTVDSNDGPVITWPWWKYLLAAVLLLLLLLWLWDYLRTIRHESDKCCDEINEKLDELLNEDSCCDDIQKSLNEISNQQKGLSHQLSNYQNTIKENSKNDVDGLGKIPEILKANGNSAGENGGIANLHITTPGGYKIDHFVGREPKGLSKQEVEEIVFNILEGEMVEETIILILEKGEEKFKTFKTKKDLEDHIKKIRKIFKKQNK